VVVDCKHYRKGVPAEALQGLLAWAEAERPQVVLVIASGFLSNPAKEHLKRYEENRRPPFRLKYWERPTLERLASGRDGLLRKYLVAEPGLRAENEILEAEQEFFDRVWYDRKIGLEERIEKGKTTVDPEIWKGAQKAMKEVEARYGKRNLGPYSDSEWGMVNGKLSALRWILGDEWDNLDS
jgi:restriction endonuclease